MTADLLLRSNPDSQPLVGKMSGWMTPWSRTVPAHLAFDHRVDVLRDLRKAGWIVLEVWLA